jgi:hypothetical protein
MNFVDGDKDQAAGVNQAAGGGASAQGAGGGAGVSGSGQPAAQQKGAAEGGGRRRKWIYRGLALAAVVIVLLVCYAFSNKKKASAQASAQQAAAQGSGNANGRGVLGAGGAETKGEELTESAIALLRKEAEKAQGQEQKTDAGGDAQGAEQQKQVSLDVQGGQESKQSTGGGFGGATSFRDTAFDTKTAGGGGGGGAVPGAGAQAAAAGEGKVEGAGSKAQGRASVPDDVSVRYAPVPGAAGVSAASPAAKHEAGAAAATEGARVSGVVPPFGSKVAVEVAGAFFAPAAEGSLVVLRVKSDAGGEGWSLPRGTLVVGRVKGVVASSRVDVAAFGYLENNKLVRFSGVLLDENEAAGLPGEVKNRDGLLKRFGRAALRGASGLPYAYRGIPYGVLPDVQGAAGQPGENKSYVMVEAGVAGVVFVTGLPSEAEGRDADSATPASPAFGELSPQEVELLKQLRGQGGARR